MLKPLIIIDNNKNYQFDNYKEVVNHVFGSDYDKLSDEEKKNVQKMNAFVNCNGSNLGIASIQSIKNPESRVDTKDKFVLYDEMTYILSLLKTNRITLLENKDSNVFTGNLDKSKFDKNYIIVNNFADELLDKYVNGNEKVKDINDQISKEELRKKAYKEVNDIINHFSDEEKNKIPEQLRNVIAKNMDKSHNFDIEKYDDISEAPLLNESKAILAVIYKDFLADEQEKAEYKNESTVQFQDKHNNQNFVNPYPFNNNQIMNRPVQTNTTIVTKENNDNINNNSISQENALAKIDDNKWYKKFINFFKNKFRKKEKSNNER